MQKKKGISLIVLVITIIVMIILATVIIISLNNSGIIEKSGTAVKQSNLKQIEEIAQLKWGEAYADGLRKQYELEEVVLAGIEDAGFDTTSCDVIVTTKGINIYPIIEKTLPKDAWQSNVAAMVGDVPIPKGFAVSSYNGERTKEEGLVIYELTSQEVSNGITELPTETHYVSLTTRNQYVWVPVKSSEFTTKFIRQDFGMGNSISNVITSGWWEIPLGEDNMPVSTLTETEGQYLSQKSLEEAQAMYASVKEYGGFYIARYEAGLDEARTSETTLVTGSDVHFKMNKKPYTYVKWAESMTEETGGAVEVARGLYPNSTENTTGVVSTLTYGVQWDTVLQWWLDTGAVSSVKNSKDYGNHIGHVIESSDDLNEGAKVWNAGFASTDYLDKTDSRLYYPKLSGVSWALTTGALKAAKVKNIYDMAGNMYEWTMEHAGNGVQRTDRGGNFVTGSDDTNVATYFHYVVIRNSQAGNLADRRSGGGFRTALYIKQ